MGDFTLFSYSTSGFTWWNLLPSAVGAILGAGASMVPAFILARHTRRQTQKASTRKAMVKLQMMLNGAESLHRAIEESVAEKEPQLGKRAPLWQKVMPIAGHAITEARFEADEVAVFLEREEDSSYGNSLLLAGERYTTLQHAVTEYNKRRLAFTDLLSEQMGKYPDGLPNEVKGALDLRTIEIEQLATEIRREAQEDFDNLIDLGDQFGRKARALFRDPKFPRLDVAEAARRRDARKALDQPGPGSTTKGKE